MSIPFLALSLLVATPPPTDCRCQCLDGAPRTLCATVESAAANPDLCTSDAPLCPTVGAVRELRQFTPLSGTQNCREAVLWDPRDGAQASIVNVCDPERPKEVDPVVPRL